MIAAGLCGLAVLAFLTAAWRNGVWVIGVRVIAALGVAAVVWGWGVAQYPVLLPGTPVTLTSAGAPHATLVAIIWLSVAAVLLVVPSFALLFTLQGRQVLRAGDGATTFAIGLAPGTPQAAGPPGQQHQSWPQPDRGSRAIAAGLIAAEVLVRALNRRRKG